MPSFGSLDTKALELPQAGPLARDGWESPAEVLNLAYELDNRQDLALIPPALHPSIPFYGNVMLHRYETSPAGPFALAELRIITRAGIHPGGYTVGAVVDTPAAAELLRSSYGAPARVGAVRLERRHYAVIGRVELDGRVIFDGALEHAEPISATDIVYHPALYLALVDGTATLVQVEPHHEPEVAERGTPRVRDFDAAAWGDARVALTNPLPATYMRGAVQLPPPRWVMDPDKPAMTGARRL